MPIREINQKTPPSNIVMEAKEIAALDNEVRVTPNTDGWKITSDSDSEELPVPLNE